MSAQSVAQLTKSRLPPGDTKHEGGGGIATLPKSGNPAF
jgi:hypothetical protein